MTRSPSTIKGPFYVKGPEIIVISKGVGPLNSRRGPHIREKVRILFKRSDKTVISKEVGSLILRRGPHKAYDKRSAFYLKGPTKLLFQRKLNH